MRSRNKSKSVSSKHLKLAKRFSIICITFILMSISLNSFAQIIVIENGNVGVKKDDPQKELDVNGTVKAKNYRDDSDQLLINSENESLLISEDADGSYKLNAIRNYIDVEEPSGNARSAMLQPRIAMYNFTVTYGTMEDDTEIFVNDVLENLVPTPSNGTFVVTQGDIITSNKPLSLIDGNRGASVPPLTGHGKYHVYFTNRVAPHTVYAYAPSGKAKIEYFFNGQATSTSVIDVEPGDFGTITLPSNGTHRFISTAPVVLLSTSSNGNNDRTFIPPASKEVLHTFSENRHTLDNISPVDNFNNVYYKSSSPMSSTQIADAAGGDAEMGLPYSYLGDTYLLPHLIKDFAIASIDPNIIRVFAYDGSSFILQNEYDFSAASRNAPLVEKVGTQSGANNLPLLFSGSPVMITGTAPFYLRTNVGSREYSALGFRASDRHALTDLNTQLSEAEVDGYVANNGYLTVTNGVPAPPNDWVITSTNGDGSATWAAPSTVVASGLPAGGVDGEVLTSDGLGGADWEESGGNWTEDGIGNITNNNSGNVGVGSIVGAPAGTLHVHAGSNTSNNDHIIQLENDNLVGLRVNSNGQINTYGLLDLGSLRGANGNSIISFHTDTDDVASEAKIIKGTDNDGPFEIRNSGGVFKLINSGISDINIDNTLIIRQDKSVGINYGTSGWNTSNALSVKGNTKIEGDSGSNFSLDIHDGSSSYSLRVIGDVNVTGDYYASGVSITSDSRLKMDVVPLAYGIDEILQLDPIQYKYNGKGGITTTKLKTGIFAQDLKKLMPSLTGEYTYFEMDEKGNETGIEETYLTIDDSGFQWVLVNAIKDQQKIIEKLERELVSNKDEVASMKKAMLEMQVQVQLLSKAVNK